MGTILGNLVFTRITDSIGNIIANYYYDDWGKLVETTGAMAIANLNPILYRSYYFDTETGLYYLNTRYYSPDMQRFLNADGYISSVGDIQGCNLFVYCANNPVNMSDSSGNWPQWIKDAANWVNNNIIQPIKNFFSPPKKTNVVGSSSHDVNRRPYTGEPGSTYEAPNGDKRTYGPDGRPKHDYDHNDHGRPDKHPHDSTGGHNHDWKDGIRGPAYSVNWEFVSGVAITTVCVVGISVIVADNATGIGVVDDFLLGPLGAGVSKGLILIFK